MELSWGLQSVVLSQGGPSGAAFIDRHPPSHHRVSGTRCSLPTQLAPLKSLGDVLSKSRFAWGRGRESKD